tara:strand:+ start:26045 stop:26686 length:642 start_codon:yes stop_codon:yes gene_type:complete
MARLFITPREIDLISDLTKEIHKDIIGQVIYYYPVREDITKVHDIYEEALDKVFDSPIEIDARVEWQQSEKTTDRFGHHSTSATKVYLHYRDVLDRGLQIREGDFFSYGDNFFEIITVNNDSLIYGQVEHVTGFILSGKTARKGQINVKPIGPTEEIYTDPDAVQESFSQQRGDISKGDKRALVSDNVVSAPISGAKSVNKTVSNKSSFYGDD